MSIWKRFIWFFLIGRVSVVILLFLILLAGPYLDKDVKKNSCMCIERDLSGVFFSITCDLVFYDLFQRYKYIM